MLSKIFFITISILVLGVLLYFLVFTGVIRVTSSIPTGAEVRIDGELVGKTNLNKRVWIGVHQVEVSKEGFETWEGEVKARSIAVTRVPVHLPFLLRSDPPGAKVLMDGENIGETDMAVHLSHGTYTFEFRKPGYITLGPKIVPILRNAANNPFGDGNPDGIVKLTPIKATSPEEEIWPDEKPELPGFGTIQVTCEPDAEVYLDGSFLGYTPLKRENIPERSYTLTLSREGYEKEETTIFVKSDKTTSFAGKLDPEPLKQ